MNIIGISGLDQSVAFKKKMFPHLSKRQYAIAQGFDAAAALVTDAGIRAAVAEERFTRQKATNAFPINAINYCLQAGNLTLDHIDYVAHGFSYEPVRDHFLGHSEFTKQQFTEVYARDVQVACLQYHFPAHDWSKKLIQVPHHLAHAASAFYVSGFQEALILIADGMGETQSLTVATGKGNDLEIIQQVSALHSLGLLYGVVTLYLGFTMGSDEFKVMGLAPYGDAKRYLTQMMDFVHLKEDGTVAVPLLQKNQTFEEKETYSGTLQILIDMFGASREPETEILQQHMDIAAALQATLERCLMHVLAYFQQQTGHKNLCMAGGVALNCTANGLIKRSGLFEDMFIQPAAGDDGSALGAALYVQRQHQPRLSNPRMALPLWGPDFTDTEIEQILAEHPECEVTHFASQEELIQAIVPQLAEGKIVAWYQGRMEYGPRALGQRSILADPRVKEMRDRINQLVKKREEFRPFAPAVTLEGAPQIFEIEAGDESLYAYMLCVTNVRRAYRRRLPAITHVNGSARVQTVSQAHNPLFWQLLNEFGKTTGIPVLLNTSFNVRGQPIVCTPTEAVETFLFARLDILVMNNYLVVHKGQTRASEKVNLLQTPIEPQLAIG